MHRTVSSVTSVKSAIDGHGEEPVVTRGKRQRQANLIHNPLPTDTLSAQHDYSGDSLVVHLSARALELLKEANTRSTSSDDSKTRSQLQETVLERRLPISLPDGDRIKTAQRSITKHDSGHAIAASAETIAFADARIEQIAGDNGTSDRPSSSEYKGVVANLRLTDASAYSIASYSLQEADYSMDVVIRKHGDTDSQSDEEPHWISRLRVSLPSLGVIDFNIAIRNGTVAIGVTSNRESAEYLSFAATELSATLADTGFRSPRIGVHSRD